MPRSDGRLVSQLEGARRFLDVAPLNANMTQRQFPGAGALGVGGWGSGVEV